MSIYGILIYLLDSIWLSNLLCSFIVTLKSILQQFLSVHVLYSITQLKFLRRLNILSVVFVSLREKGYTATVRCLFLSDLLLLHFFLVNYTLPSITVSDFDSFNSFSFIYTLTAFYYTISFLSHKLNYTYLCFVLSECNVL